MKVKEVEVTKKEKIYELTESEYNELINKERSYGARKTKEYIGFCWDNYYYELNIKGMMNFIRDLMYFVNNKNNYIDNIYDLSFWQWLERNR